MRKIRRYVVAFFLGAFFISAAGAWEARLHHVADGDTVTVVKANNGKKVRVRLHAIDAPEIDHGAKRPGQPYGKRAKRYLEVLLTRAAITIEPTGDTSYGRIVAKVYADGNNVARDLVSAGLAWAYPWFDTKKEYAPLQATAKQRQVGMWAQAPIEPWIWRRTMWQ